MARRTEPAQVYESQQGIVLVEDGGVRVEAYIHCRARRSVHTGAFIARCASFQLVGQGESAQEARRSLESVLTNHLDLYHRVGRLDEVLVAPTWQLRSSGSMSSTLERLMALRDLGPVVHVGLERAA